MNDSKKEYRTAARTGIMDYLKTNADRTVSAQDIARGLKENALEINISTVYRYLGRLSDEGLINRFTAEGSDASLYQYAAPVRSCNDHIHLQCRNCGHVIHLDCHFMDEITEHIMEHHGFELICKGSVLLGLCANCREKMNAEGLS